MGLDVKQLQIPPDDAYRPGAFTDAFIRPLVRSFVTLEIRAATEAVMAYLEGDEEPLRALVDEWLVEEWPAKGPTKRRRSNAFYTTELKADYLVHGEQLPIPLVVRFLKAWEERLEERTRTRHNEKQVERLYARYNKNPGWELMRSLRDYPEPPHKRLRTDLPGAVMRAEAEGYYGDALRRRVAAIIKDDNRPLRETRKVGKDRHGDPQYKIVSSEAPADTLDGLDDYAGVEDALLVDDIIGRAGLSPRELEVVAMCWRGLKPEEIAAELGTKRSTVDNQLRNIERKVKTVA